MPSVTRIAVTGAAGQIGYSLLFRLAAGELLGPEQRIALSLLELPQAQAALQGLTMELQDGAFPLLDSVVCTDQPEKAFEGADIVFLVGSRPRTQGMERRDLLEANATIFRTQGRALHHASASAKVLVVGNPANTNALIAQHHAVPHLAPAQIHAMMRLDHHRATAQLAQHLDVPVGSLHRMVIWGNHSATQCPDPFHVLHQGQPVSLEPDWVQNHLIPQVQHRGAAVIKARGASSAASAAHAALCHMRDWCLGTGEHWTTMGVASDGSYGIAHGVVFGLPCRTHEGAHHVVQDLMWHNVVAPRLQRSYQELLDEREAVRAILRR